MIDRVPEGVCVEICNTVQEVVRNHHQEKKCNQAKWLSEETLQIAEKRGKAKGKGGREIFTHMNAEFQRIARKDKKAFLSDQCKEIEKKKTE